MWVEKQQEKHVKSNEAQLQELQEQAKENKEEGVEELLEAIFSQYHGS